MAQVYRQVNTTHTSPLHIVAHIVSLAGGVIVSILGIRFLLTLLGANPANSFANFIYNTSQPFISPFTGLFNIQEQIGVIRFEFETLIAMAFWAFVTWIIVRMLQVTSPRTDV